MAPRSLKSFFKDGSTLLHLAAKKGYFYYFRVLVKSIPRSPQLINSANPSMLGQEDYLHKITRVEVRAERQPIDYSRCFSGPCPGPLIRHYRVSEVVAGIKREQLLRHRRHNLGKMFR